MIGQDIYLVSNVRYDGARGLEDAETKYFADEEDATEEVEDLISRFEGGGWTIERNPNGTIDVYDAEDESDISYCIYKYSEELLVREIG